MALVWWLKHFALKLRYIIPLEVRTSTYEIFSNMYFYFSKSFGIWISLKRMSFFSMLTSSSNFSLQHSSYLSSSICTAFPTVAIFRQMGDFWGRAGDHFFAKIASEIWAIFGQLAKIGQFWVNIAKVGLQFQNFFKNFLNFSNHFWYPF